MEDNTYIKYTRSLHTNPIFKSMSFEYRHIFMTILVNMAFKPIQLNDHGILIDLKPGQFMTTLRDLVKLCDEEGIDKRKIERALIMFEKVGFSRQETGHRKTIITVTEPSICESIKTEIGTRNGTKTGQERDKNGTQKKKEEKEENEEEETHGLAAVGCDVIIPSKFEDKEPKRIVITRSNDDHQEHVSPKPKKYSAEVKKSFGKENKVKLTQFEFEDLVNYMSENERDYWIEQIRLEIGKKGEQVFNKKYQSHYHTILSWHQWRKENSKITPLLIKRTPEDNRRLAQEFKNQYQSKYYTIEILSKGVEFTPQAGQSLPDVVLYDSHGFKEQIENLIIKRRFEILKVK